MIVAKYCVMHANTDGLHFVIDFKTWGETSTILPSMEV